MTSSPSETDVLIVGAGPAGTAGALMAASLGLRTMVVEAERVGGRLHDISAVQNVPGDWSNGAELARACAADLERLQEDDRCTLLSGRAVAVKGLDDRAELTLETGQVLAARGIVVATGVTTLMPVDTDWLSAPTDFVPPPLWRAVPDALPRPVYVLGADRPLGTWLRAHPQTPTLHVLCPRWDRYKAAEIVNDDRVRLVATAHASISLSKFVDAWDVEVEGDDGERTTYQAGTVLANIGSKPRALLGLVADDAGYCPPHKQHPRIRTAGDIRSGRFQRITTAQGSGAEAVLGLYYETVSRS